MNLVILGATGGTGRLVVEQALADGHTVTALVRSPEKVTIRNSNLRVIAGKATDAGDVARAFEGADAVISTLGGTGSVIADSTRAILEAAHKTGVERVVVLSSFFVERDRLSAVSRLLTGIAAGSKIKDKSAGEQLLRKRAHRWPRHRSCGGTTRGDETPDLGQDLARGRGRMVGPERNQPSVQPPQRRDHRQNTDERERPTGGGRP